jgi:pyridoxamine 5'-phosphate oxidase
MKVSDVRREYALAGLSEEDLAADPIAQLRLWLDQARAVLPEEFNTHYDSDKGRELAANPRAALVFYWAPLDRQVRIEGTVEKTSREESEAYFASRPRGSRLGAWASRQSRPLAGREELERRMEEVAERFADGDVPLPDGWGGFRVRPEVVEFWQGRPSRLHDRLRYVRDPEGDSEGGWRIERLAP